eukprot:scaffold2409_cov230-Alexandrium_tamarense.AAC.2
MEFADMQMNTQQKRYALSRSSAIKATFFSLVLFYFLEDISKPIFSTAMNEEAGETTSNHLVMRDVNFPKKIDSGWDESGIALYKDRVKSLAKEGVIDTTVYPPGPTDTKGGLLEERVNAFAVSNRETLFSCWGLTKHNKTPLFIRRTNTNSHVETPLHPPSPPWPQPSLLATTTGTLPS